MKDELISVKVVLKLIEDYVSKSREITDSTEICLYFDLFIGTLGTRLSQNRNDKVWYPEYVIGGSFCNCPGIACEKEFGCYVKTVWMYDRSDRSGWMEVLIEMEARRERILRID